MLPCVTPEDNSRQSNSRSTSHTCMKEVSRPRKYTIEMILRVGQIFTIYSFVMMTHRTGT